MNSFFPILNWAGLLLLKEKLSHCTPYQEAERDSRAQWAAFKAAFCLGLQLGLELGGLGRFWDTEP